MKKINCKSTILEFCKKLNHNKKINIQEPFYKMKNFDSLFMLNLILIIEKKYKIHLSSFEISKLSNIKELINIVEQKYGDN